MFQKNIATIATQFIGNKEYPRVQTQWKNDIFPPKSYALIAITAAPTQITQNTVPKIIVDTVACEAMDNVQAKEIHKTKGPQRSQFLSFFPFPKGIMTNLILLRICLMSLTIET